MLATLLFTFTMATDTVPIPVVVVVRHAEKAAEAGRDPGLSEAGWARAAALDSTLMDAKVSVILITPYRRNRETAQLVAERHGITPTVVPIAQGIPDYAAAVAALALKAEGTVLVVGHSNTLDDVVTALGGNGAFGDLCEHQYESIWFVFPGQAGARTVRARFGADNPPTSNGCAQMH